MRRPTTLLLLTASLLCGGAPSFADDEKKKWAHHSGDLEFVIGYDKGKAESKFTGKPMMVFFTATW